MKIKPVYCASEGCGPVKIIKNLVCATRDLPSWPQLSSGAVLPTYKGRVAIWLLCKLWELRPDDEVLMPAYNCGSEVDPFLCWGTKVVFYRVNTKANIDIEDIQRRTTHNTRIVYVTHYFGWPQELRELLNWCHERNILLVEDCALALFSFSKEGHLGTIGDSAIFSFRKFLALPDGGVLILQDHKKAKTDIPFQPPPTVRTFVNTLPLLKSHLIRDIEKVGLYAPARNFSLYLRRDTNSENTSYNQLPDMPSSYYFNKDIQNYSISRISIGILRQPDPSFVIKRRRENYKQLAEIASEIPSVSLLFDRLPDGVCPLGLPLIVSQRSRWVKALNAYGIAAFPWWEGYNIKMSWNDFPEARYLKDNILVLPTHQILGQRHMRFITQCMRKFSRILGQTDGPLQSR